MGMDLNSRRRRAAMAHRWFGIEFGAVAVLVTVAWINEPGSLGRLALMCACWTPFVYGAVLRVRGRLR